MCEAHLDESWSHTSSLLALIANVNRDPKKTGPFKASDFHPGKRKQPVTETADISVLKDVFIKPQTPITPTN